jgi:hypothetical protein
MVNVEPCDASLFIDEWPLPRFAAPKTRKVPVSVANIGQHIMTKYSACHSSRTPRTVIP